MPLKATSVGEPDDAKEFIENHCHIFPRELRSIVEATPAADILQTDVYDSDPMPCRRGRVLLIGDAAHPVVHHFGQGACLAVEDAVRLCKCLHTELGGAVEGKGGLKQVSWTNDMLEGALAKFDTWGYWLRTWMLVYISRWCGSFYMDNRAPTNWFLRFCFLFPMRLTFVGIMRVLLFMCHRDLRTFADVHLSKQRPDAGSGSISPRER